MSVAACSVEISRTEFISFLQSEERQEELFIVVCLLLKRIKIVAPLYYTFYHMLWTIAKVQVDVRSVNMNK